VLFLLAVILLLFPVAADWLGKTCSPLWRVWRSRTIHVSGLEICKRFASNMTIVEAESRFGWKQNLCMCYIYLFRCSWPRLTGMSQG